MHRAILLMISLIVAIPAAQGDEMLESGSDFPSFSLEAHDGSTVSSRGLAGSAYLIYFYPKADTPGCTKEACAFRDSWAEVQFSGLRVYGASYDEPEDNAAFAEKFSLQFLLLSDTDKELAAAVGAKRTLMPFPKRISYLVGTDGKVIKAYPSVSPKEHAMEVLADFKELAPQTSELAAK